MYINQYGRARVAGGALRRRARGVKIFVFNNARGTKGTSRVEAVRRDRNSLTAQILVIPFSTHQTNRTIAATKTERKVARDSSEHLIRGMQDLRDK